MSKEQQRPAAQDGNDQPEVSVQQALKAIRDMRSTITSVFEVLQGSDFPNADPSDHLAWCSTAVPELCNSIPDYLDTLDRFVNGTSRQPLPSLNPNINTLIKGDSADESKLYENLVKSYNYMKHVREHFTWVAHYLTPYTRRNQSKFMQRVNQPSFLQMNPAYLNNILPYIQRQYNGMQITTIPRGRSTFILMVTLNHPGIQPEPTRPPGIILKAAILWRGLQMEWGNVLGPDESFYDDYEKLDLFRQSRSVVFQKITNQVKGMILQCNSTNPSLQLPQAVIRQFFNWFYMFRGIFVEPCHNCKKHLRDFLPAIYPEMRDGKACLFHEGCR